MGAPAQEFGNVLKALFRFARYATYLSIGLLGVWLADRLVAIHTLAAKVHPLLGWAAVLTVLGLLGVLVGRPAWRFLKVPVAVRPPPMPEPEKRTADHLRRHLDYLERYVAGVRANPQAEVTEEAAQVALTTVRALRDEISKAPAEALRALCARASAIDRDVVGPLLTVLDRKASDAIRNEAIGVGIATAISPNGTIDAFVVLWRNVNMVSRIAAIYYGRPGVRGTLQIVRDVSTATLASAYLENVTDVAGGAIGSIAGKTVGTVAGPLLDGCLNAIGTLRIGYVAKARCRSFSAWTLRTRTDAMKDALVEAGRMSKGLVYEIVSTVGGTILRLPLKILGGIKDAVMGLFRKPEPGPEAGEA